MATSDSCSVIDSIYTDHHGWLRGWLRRRIDCPDDAADLTQDTFVRLLRSPQSVTLREPRHYLVVIARGLVIDLFRRRSLERQYAEALALVPEREWPSEEERALIVETLLQLDAVLTQLGGRVREVFILSQFEGLTYAQIAARLGLSLRTVNNYMVKAIEQCCLVRMQHA